MKKYEFTGKNKTVDGTTLYQIIAVKDFADVKEGDIGGWIESEENLSQEGDCWVSDNAQVFGDAQVSGNARISGDTQVSGNAWVYGW